MPLAPLDYTARPYEHVPVTPTSNLCHPQEALAKACAGLSITDLHSSLSMTGVGTVAGPGNTLTACTVLPGADLWISLSPGDQHAGGRDIHRRMTGAESLLLNGFPCTKSSGPTDLRTLVAQHSNALMQELGGNSFPGTIISAFIIAITFAFDNHVENKNDDDGDDEDPVESVAMAMSLFKKARKS